MWIEQCVSVTYSIVTKIYLYTLKQSNVLIKSGKDDGIFWIEMKLSFVYVTSKATYTALINSYA